MTALAALSMNAESAAIMRNCNRMLVVQGLYGKKGRRTKEHDNVAVGVNLSSLLPEDVFDKQPYYIHHNDGIFVADIRLDNRHAIASKLNVAADLPIMSDCQLACLAFEAWGMNSFDQLKGDFAIIVWDGAKHRFILARDPFGARPLYFFHASGMIAISSMPKGLNVLEEVSGIADTKFISDSMQNRGMVSDGTYWKDVRRVLPGHIAIVDGNHYRQIRYWDPPEAKLSLPDHNEYVEALRDLINLSVSKRLRGETRIGTHLSAGLDSGAITATSARLLGRRGSLVAFTAAPRLGYAEKSQGILADESVIAAETACLYENIEHVVLRPGNDWCLEAIERHFSLTDAPAINICNLEWIHSIYDETLARGIKVLMPADLGNLAMSYSGEFSFAEYLLKWKILEYLSKLYKSQNGNLRHLAARMKRDFVNVGPNWIKRRVHGVRYSPSLKREDIQFKKISSYKELILESINRADFGPIHKAALGGWGIDIRDPSMDRDIFEFALSVPVEQYMRCGKNRALIRSAMSNHMSHTALALRQRGVQGADWHIGAEANIDWLRGQLEAMSDSREVTSVIDVPRLQALLDKWPKQGWQNRQMVEEYRLALFRGVSIGHFIRRASGANR